MMKKWLVGLLAVLLALGAVFIFTNREAQKNNGHIPNSPAISSVNLLNPSGPTVLPLAGISHGKVDTKGIDVKVHYWKTPDEATAMLASNRAEFAVLPITMAANLHPQVPLALLGVHEWKSFYLVAGQNAPFPGWASLRGQQVYTAVGKGSTVDLLMRAILEKKGLVPGQDVKLVYAPPQDIVALVKSGKAQYAALPEPFVSVTLQGDGGRIIADLQQSWAEATGGEERLPVAGLFVKKDFLSAHPRETEQVATALAASTAWSGNNLDEAITLSQEILSMPAAVIKQAYPRMDFVYIPASECSGEVEAYLVKMKQLYPEGLKELPGAEFYNQ